MPREHRSCGILFRVKVAIPEGANVVALADEPVLHHLFGADVELVRAVLRADLDDAARLLRQLDDLGAFFDGVADRLLEIDMLVGLQSGHRHRVMQMFRRSR